MERAMDSIGMLMMEYDNYVKARKAEGALVKSFGKFILGAFKGTN